MDIRRTFIKLCSWEYWPMWVVYFPVSFYYVFLAVKARSLFFFSAANPTIETGGMFFESKWSIFKLMPPQLFPTTIYLNGTENCAAVCAMIKQHAIDFPVVAKPDRGERGWRVQVIRDEQALAKYVSNMRVAYLVQAYIDYPLELSVFYYRHPTKSTGTVTSVTLKKMLSVTGDGMSTIAALIQANDRAYLQLQSLRIQQHIDFSMIPQANEVLQLVPYGNHVLGATFLNYNHIIDDALIKTFDDISKQIDGFYFGRYDLRCKSIADLKEGKHFSILEVNGTGAEPAHIYDPSFSFFKAQRVIAQHYKMMYNAAVENNRLGVAYMSWADILQTRRQERDYKLLATCG